MKELGKKSLNGNITDCKYCDVKHGFKVCCGKCPKEDKKDNRSHKL